MCMIKVDISQIQGFIPAGAVQAMESEAKEAIEKLEKGTGLGNDYIGWVNLASSISAEFIAEIDATAAVLKENCDVVVVAGIGGSYLGAKAVIEAFSNSFAHLLQQKDQPVVLFAGHNISEDYLFELTQYLSGKRFGVINISKSGTTTETALAFRLLKKQCEDERGKEMAKKVIVAITDANKGAARVCADKEGYKSFVIPDNVGGRYSVLTPVGLLPIAVAGFNTCHIGADRSLNVSIGKFFGYHLGIFNILTTNSKIRETFHCHLFCMTRTCYYRYIFYRNSVIAMEII